MATKRLPEPLLTARDIVEKYGVTRKTVHRWVSAGDLTPAQTLPGRTGAHLFTPEAAEAAFGPHLRRRQRREQEKAAAEAARATTDTSAAQ